VIKNLNLLFGDNESNSSQYNKINEIFDWLLKNEKEGLLEVILCNSGHSLISTLRKCKFNLYSLFFFFFLIIILIFNYYFNFQ